MGAAGARRRHAQPQLRPGRRCRRERAPPAHRLAGAVPVRGRAVPQPRCPQGLRDQLLPPAPARRPARRQCRTGPAQQPGGRPGHPLRGPGRLRGGRPRPPQVQPAAPLQRQPGAQRHRLHRGHAGGQAHDRRVLLDGLTGRGAGRAAVGYGWWA
ncbi:hypothetical protein SGPA1_50409 [Streptomyces misionensis JCM 4497]